MSSILKALEKVERDLAGQGPQPPGGTRPISRPHTGVQSADRLWRPGKGVVLIVGIAALAIFGGVFAAKQTIFTPTTIPPLSKPSPARKDTVQPDIAPPAGKSQVSNVRSVGPAGELPQPPGVQGQTPADRPLPQRESEIDPDAGRPMPAAKAGPAEFRIDEPVAAVPDDRVSEKSTARQDIQPETDPVQPGPDIDSRKTPAERISPSIPLLAASDLKLHAIAWSPMPAQRMAVINNNVTREGDVIEGFSIVRIAPDEILIEKNQEKWRLMLRR